MNVEGSTTLVLFHDPPALRDRCPDETSAGESVDYLRTRQRAEKAAAGRAQCMKARQVHEELAEHYSRQIDSSC